MSRLTSSVDPSSEAFAKNAQANRALVEDLRAKVAADGSLHLTPEAVAAMGLAPGERLVMRPDGEEVRINSSDKALKAIRKEFRRLVPEGRSVVDEFLADKKAEAARE